MSSLLLEPDRAAVPPLRPGPIAPEVPIGAIHRGQGDAWDDLTPVEQYVRVRDACAALLHRRDLTADEAALLETLRRRAVDYRAHAPVSLMQFISHVTPSWKPSAFHRLLVARLERFVRDVERNKSPRLMITLPPRHGKSTLASEHLPAWVFGTHPDWPIIHCSYSSDFSNKWSRKVRRMLRTPEYQELFPGVLPARESSAVDFWEIEGKAGYMVSTGIGGQLTGQGCRVGIIDDPVKNTVDAASPLIQERNREWYAESLMTRLEDKGGILLLLTRWHLDDLGGFLKDGHGTDAPPTEEWEEVRLPALAEDADPLGRVPGTALWPEKYDERALGKLKAALPPKSWQALYQQSPVEAQGNLLKVNLIRACAISPLSPDVALMRVFQGWDLAISQADDAAFTVGFTLAVDNDNNLFLLDVARERLTFNETMRAMAREAERWKPDRIAIEAVAYQSSAFQEAARRYMLPFVKVVPKPHEDKVMRAQLLADRIEMGKVYANKADPWWNDFREEAAAFPKRGHKDQIDAAAWALSLAPVSPDPETDPVRLHPMSHEGARHQRRERLRMARRNRL